MDHMKPRRHKEMGVRLRELGVERSWRVLGTRLREMILSSEALR